MLLAHPLRVLLVMVSLAASLAAQSQDVYDVSTLAGKPGQSFGPPADGTGSAASFASPAGIVVARSGDLYVCDTFNKRLCKITPAGVVTTIATEATSGGLVQLPFGIAIDHATGDLYVADYGAIGVLKISPQHTVSLFAGVRGEAGYNDSTGDHSLFNYPHGIVLLGDYVYVADSGNHVIRRIHKTTRVVSTLAGKAGESGMVSGAGDVARFGQPLGLAIDHGATEAAMLVTDYTNGALRRVFATGVVETVVLGLAQPQGVAVDAAGLIYLPDTAAHTIRRISREGVTTILAGRSGVADLIDGPGGDARFSYPTAIALGGDGRIYVADIGNTAFRVLTRPRALAITGALATANVELGATVEFGPVAFTSSLTPTYQWLKNGAPIAGATGPTLRIAGVTRADVGAYSLRLTTNNGSETSNAAELIVRAAPEIASLPAAQSLTGTGGTALTAQVSGSGPFTYQWLRGGVPLAGATGATFTATLPGLYTVAVTNPYGRTVSGAATLLPAKRLVNLATRGVVRGTTQTMIGGLSVSSDDGRDKTFLIRAVGPSLAAFGVTDGLARPSLTVYRGSTPIAVNAGWSTRDAERIAAAGREVGAFALTAGSADAALHATLAPESYTLEVSGLNNAEGSVLLEVYELSADLGRLVNLSTRGVVTESQPLTAGIVVRGSAPVKLLIRAIGPALTPFGVAAALPAPRLTVHGSGVEVGSNAGWSTGANPNEIAAAATATGAFALTTGSQDSALLLTLAAGSYTAEIGSRGGSGTALVEVYEVP